MQRYFVCFAFMFAFIALSAVNAQDEPNLPKAEKEHQWLKQFVGQWQTESEAKMGPDQPPMKCTGTMSSRMLGDFWVISELVGEMPGVTVTGLQTIGYDTKKKKYVGTWVDSVASHMWKYEGSIDQSGKSIVLETEGPNFMADGKIVKFRDAYTFESKDHIIATSSMQNADGSWLEFMRGDFRRAQ